MREIHTIEVDRWEPSEKKGMVKHVGMIAPQEAFDALERHLKESDLMPDEYFNPNQWHWNDVKELPNYLRASCDVNWGGSEGIYLDVALLYRDENDQMQRFNLATGKTLGESGDDFLRMSRIAAECSMMLNGRGEVVRFYEEENMSKNVDSFGEKAFSAQEIDEWPFQVCDLVATYEELYNIPSEQQMTVYFGSYGQHFFKTPEEGATPDRVSDLLHKALRSIDMTLDEFVSQKDLFIHRSEIKKVMKNKMHEPLSDKIGSAQAVVKKSAVSGKDAVKNNNYER